MRIIMSDDNNVDHGGNSIIRDLDGGTRFESYKSYKSKVHRKEHEGI